MKTIFGNNIRITISDETSDAAIAVTIAGLPAGVDLEKEDFMQGPGALEPRFGEGRLLCKDGSFVTDGRPFTINFDSGTLSDAIRAAGVMARHIIAPIRIRPVSPLECLCTCMPAGLQLSRAAISIPGICRSILDETALADGLSNGEDLQWKIEGESGLVESIAALSIADSLFF